MQSRFDVVICGAGPAGIFTALELSKREPGLAILIVDMGRELARRACPLRDGGECLNCEPCNITSGWSGAGGFSDGKLSRSPHIGGRLTEYMPEEQLRGLIEYIDGVYREFGAPERVYGEDERKIENLQYEASRHAIELIPCSIRHLGTEKVYEVFAAIFRELVREGGVRFEPLTRVERVLVENGRARGVLLCGKGTDGERHVRCENVVLAPGRGGARWLTEQCRRLGITTVNNEVDIGVRVEVPNSIMDHLTEHLYEAKLIYYSDTFEDRVRSFCMNPGGEVSEEHYEGEVALVNGHSYAEKDRRTANTNFALLVSTSFTRPFNQPLEYGKYIARLANMLTGGGIMVQRLGDLLKGRRTNEKRLARSTTVPTMDSAVPGDLSYVLPHRYLTSITETLRAFENICPGIYNRDTLLYGVEVKFYSSKVRVSGSFETRIRGLYTIGDGAGLTRGLMQASVTGVVVAREIAHGS